MIKSMNVIGIGKLDRHLYRKKDIMVDSLTYLCLCFKRLQIPYSFQPILSSTLKPLKED